MIICKVCKQNKPEWEYYHKRDGSLLSGLCKSCFKAKYFKKKDNSGVRPYEEKKTALDHVERTIKKGGFPKEFFLPKKILPPEWFDEPKKKNDP